MRFNICRSPIEREQFLLNLKLTPCPHCKTVGSLNRHGFLKAFQGDDVRAKSVRATRVFCSNRGRSQGCGRTFSVWIADKIKRLFLSSTQLWQFLKETTATGNKRNAFKKLDVDMSDSAPYRIWKRFQKAQAAIRTALCALCAPPECERNDPDNSDDQNQPTASTLAHLIDAFNGSQLNTDLGPIAAFQVARQTFFV